MSRSWRFVRRDDAREEETIIRKPLLSLMGLLLLGAASASSAAEPPDAVVKIYATQLAADYGAPWKAGTPRSFSGSGFVIDGGRILTNAHVVSGATFIQVRRHGASERVPARVLHVSDEADLALLTVDAPGFFESIPALELGGLPQLQQEILVLGFPVGGDTLSVTRGVVSRIESRTYVHAGSELLAGQIDSAVNPGNSGGPVLVDGKVAGVVMQAVRDASNTAYMIPTPVVERFLADVADGRYDGVPQASFRWQRLEAADLRRRYALPTTGTGILILDTMPGSAASAALRAGDILLSVDGRSVGGDGTIELRPRERTAFTVLLQQRQIGESVALELLREGRRIDTALRLDRRVGTGSLVRGPLYGERPSYYVFGGLVFCPLTVNYIQAWGEEWRSRAPGHLLALLDRPARFDGEEAVVVCAVLPAEVNSGYEEIVEDLVSAVDGQPVRGLRQLIQAVESRQAGLLVLETQDGKQVVFDREPARRRGPGILAHYQVQSDRSEDLLAATAGRSSRIVASSVP